MDDLSQILIPSLFGLLGVLVGGLITTQSQKRERLQARKREQLDGFYSPLLGMRARMVAISQVRTKVTGATDRAWRNLFRGVTSPEVSQKLVAQHQPEFAKVVDAQNKALTEVILPLYRDMVEHFQTNMGLAEPSTRAYFGALVEFIEIWDRWLDDSLPSEVVAELDHSEDKLQPFYRDLADQLDHMQRELKR